VFFGAAHLLNVLFRANPFLVFAQAVGAFSEGVGFGALRLRTNTIWPLIFFHFSEDLLLRFTRLPAIPLNVLQSVVLLVYGIYLLRGMRGPKGQGRPRKGRGPPERVRGHVRGLASGPHAEARARHLVGIAFYVLVDAVLNFLAPHHGLVSQPESDYAVGPYGFLMSANFVLRGLFSLALVTALRPLSAQVRGETV
jgi:hypothetical protein